MRIITGTARGTRLITLEGEATRPTGEMVKEALFSMIQFDIEGRRALDLFAGSGQLGLEALSRGAASAVMTDISRDAVDVILANAQKARLREHCSVSAMDYQSYLKGAAGRVAFDLIFLDPPYNTDCMANALRLIADGWILAPGGVIVCETDTEETERKKRAKKNEDADEAVKKDVFMSDEALMGRFTVRKTARYGRTRITLLEAASKEDE